MNELRGVCKTGQALWHDAMSKGYDAEKYELYKQHRLLCGDCPRDFKDNCKEKPVEKRPRGRPRSAVPRMSQKARLKMERDGAVKLVNDFLRAGKLTEDGTDIWILQGSYKEARDNAIKFLKGLDIVRGESR